MSRILLFVHGNIISSLYFQRLAEELRKRDPTISMVAIDLRGLGNSQSISSVNKIKDFSDDIYAFIKENYPKSQIIPIGWSLGGCVVMKLASDYPSEFKHLILVASAGAHGHHLLVDSNQQSIKQLTRGQIQQVPKIKKNLEMLQKKNYEFFYKLFKNALFNSGRDPSKLDFLDYITESLKQTNYLDVAVVLNELDISKEVNKIQGPVLLFHGELDRIVPISDVYKNIQNIGKEKCKLIVEQNVSHMPPLEVPEILAQEILNFIR